MVGTFQALGLLVLTVLPGAVLLFSYERHAGPLTGEGNDRALRFVLGTVLVFPYTALVAAWAYTRVLHVEGPEDYFRNRLEDPVDLSPAWSLLPLAYVVVPWCVGWLAGRVRVDLRRRSVENRSTSLVPGVAAWDIVFLQPGPKLISAKLRGGPWVAGLFAAESFASSLASRHKELVLEQGVAVDARGKVERDKWGTPLARPGGIVLSYTDVELMIVEPA